MYTYVNKYCSSITVGANVARNKENNGFENFLMNYSLSEQTFCALSFWNTNTGGAMAGFSVKKKNKEN